MNRNNHKPPLLSKWLLKRSIRYDNLFPVVGDFEEAYNEHVKRKGLLRARMWYRWQVAKSLPSCLFTSLYWSIIMLKSYFLVALRTIRRHKLNSFLNITGLAVGMACTIMIVLFVLNENSYDRFHENADRIFRIHSIQTTNAKPTENAWSPVPKYLNSIFKLPEVENAVRLSPYRRSILKTDNNNQFQEQVLQVDSTFFDVFSFSLLQGDKETALKDPYSIVITPAMANKFFSTENALGKSITFVSRRKEYNLTVTGIMKPMPFNSHLDAEIIIPHSIDHSYLEWGITYVLLRENTDLNEFAQKYNTFIIDNWDGRRKIYEYFLRPLTGLYFINDLSIGLGETGNKDTVNILAVIATIILLITTTNFIILTTAQMVSRVGEIGIRKTFGALRKDMTTQFFGEILVKITIAFLFALFFIYMLQPWFLQIIGKDLVIQYGMDSNLYIAAGLVLLCTAVVAGIYPALFMASYNPVKALRKEISHGSSSVKLRKSALLLQFALSLIFLIMTIAVLEQLAFIRDRDMGIDIDEIINIPTWQEGDKAELNSFKQEVLRNPAILSVSSSMAGVGSGFYFSRNVQPIGQPEDEEIAAAVNWVGGDFFQTVGADIVMGRGFSEKNLHDIDDSIGKELDVSMEEPNRILKIIGIVKDFHYESLHKDIGPGIYCYKSPKYVSSNMIIRIDKTNQTETISFMKEKWGNFSKNPFRYVFARDNFSSKYNKEERERKVFIAAFTIALLLNCFGLFGLSSFTTQRRTKEIGIRKICGATVSGIYNYLCKEFILLVILANIIAWPAGYYVVEYWLRNFAYHFPVTPSIFLYSMLIVICITLLAVSYHAIRAARANPVDSLRYE
ncbi:ABC transporter permease [candidate division KSB1 bacterium]